MNNTSETNLHELVEYIPKEFRKEDIPKSLGESLYQHYRTQVSIEFPSIKTNDKWQITSLGWVGHIPLTREYGFIMLPKISLENIFRMLEYAYRLKSFKFLEGSVECNTLKDFYERLANILAKRVLDRSRKGFYRKYIPRNDDLPFMRGRLNIPAFFRKPWSVNLSCDYENHTPNIKENKILAWTLWNIARSGMCSERVLPTVRQAFRSLLGFVILTPFSAKECVSFLYNRLNLDYQPMHSLCRFFLEQRCAAPR